MIKTTAIILNYNCADKTIRLVASIRKSDNHFSRVIIVDNASTDDSVVKLRLIHDIDLIESKKNLGYAAGNNLGIRKAHELGTDFHFIINPDIVFNRQIVRDLAEYMVNHPEVGVCAPKQVTGERHASIGVHVRLGHANIVQPIINKDNSLTEIQVDSIVGAAFAVRDDALSTVGLIPEAYFLNFEDTEWCLNFERQGYTVVVLNELSVNHQVHGSIGKISGLEEYYLVRNSVVFTLRNGSKSQIITFMISKIVIALLSSIKHRKLLPLRALIDGLFYKDMYGHFINNLKKVVL